MCSAREEDTRLRGCVGPGGADADAGEGSV